MTTIFIAGCMRSGTSLLTSVLCSGPATNPVIAEVQYLKRKLDAYAWGRKNFSSFLKDTFGDLEDFDSFTGREIGEYLDRTRRRWQPCEHLVLKNPEIIQYFPELDELVEDAKFIVTVRDPRDTVLSMREVARKQRDQGTVTTLTKMNDGLEALSKFYNAYYFRLLRGDFAKLRPRLTVVRYEDLVSRTPQVIRDLAEFSGLHLGEFDPASAWQRTAQDYAALRRDPHHGAWTTELYGKAVSDQSIGRFRDAFSRAEIKAVEDQCQDIMRLFRYDFVEPERSPA